MNSKKIATELLIQLLPAQFDLVISKYEMPTSFLGRNLAQAQQALQVIQYAEQKKDRSFEHLLQVIYEVAPHLKPNVNETPTDLKDSQKELKRPQGWDLVFHTSWRNLSRLLRINLVMSAAITGCVIGIRSTGLLQPLEFYFYDSLIREQTKEDPDPRLFIIQVSKKDIENQKKDIDYRKGISLTNSTLLKILKKLTKDKEIEGYEPRVIGLDIIRDYGIEIDKSNKNELLEQVLPINRELAGILKNDSRIVAGCFIGNRGQSPEDFQGADPPPEVPQVRLGAMDVYPDKDSVVRRQPLVYKPYKDSKCRSSSDKINSLSLEVAQRYLKAAEKTYEESKVEKGFFTPFQIGDIVFEELDSNYRGIYFAERDTSFFDGYQILLNYLNYYNSDYKTYSPKNIAETVTVEAFLRSDFLKTPGNKEQIKDRIVLIGVTDATYSPQDSLGTPFGSKYTNPLPGVILHAQMVSQILRIGMDGQPQLRIWSVWCEYIWIFCWSVVGGVTALIFPLIQRLLLNMPGISQMPSFLNFSILIFFFAPGINWTTCKIIFLGFSYWVPFVPAAFALVSTGGVVFAWFYYQEYRFAKS